MRQPCEVCGAEPAEAHHDDYTKLLDVRWLCNAHHRTVHPESSREPRRRFTRNVHASHAPREQALAPPHHARGGRRRAEVLSPERRSQIARQAAQARWAKT